MADVTRRTLLPARSSFATCLAVAVIAAVTMTLVQTNRTVSLQALLPSTRDLADVFVNGSIQSLVSCPLFAATLYAIERLPFSGASRWVAVSALMLAAAVPIAAMGVYALPHEVVAIRLGFSPTREEYFRFRVWEGLVAGILAVVTLDRLRERRQAVERLAAVQEQSRTARQQLAHARLQAIQARVDPQLLFDMLATVKRFYAFDVQRAEGLLDELNAFLRAALPRLRSARSSLGVEIALVASHQRLLQGAFDMPAGPEPVLPESLADAVFPAGVLLPLASAGCPRGEALMQLEAEALDGRVRVRVTLPRTPGEATLERLRSALADLYGESASLRLASPPERGPQATIVELEVPHERE